MMQIVHNAPLFNSYYFHFQFHHSPSSEVPSPEMSSRTVGWIPLLLLLLCMSACFYSAAAKKATYIIQMSKSEMPMSYEHHLDWYASTLRSLDSISVQSESREDPSERIIYSYENAFHGFAALLSSDEAARLESNKGVVAVFPDTVYQLHTTRSAEFLGLETEAMNTMWSAAIADHDVVVGVIDTGIWPESPSFNDSGMGPVPVWWKGVCEEGRGFSKKDCNRKIIGARIFYNGYEASMGTMNEEVEYKSSRDQDGHGTHTAATAAGVPVHGANLLGYAMGTARGMAPHARVAAYKVCWPGGCFSSDLLSAVDQAVADGVNVLSISLGGGVSSYARDSLSVAAFGAMEKGVFVTCSAGNGGPDPITLTNVSPWITTVGASTMDRDFPSFVGLGNGANISGVSLYRGQRKLLVEKQYPLVYLGGNQSTPDPRSLCLEGTLDPKEVAGKIVLCDRGISARVRKGQVVKDAGGLGMILANNAANGEELVADCHLLPALAVGESAGIAIKQYALSILHPTATISFAGTKLGIKPSPVVAAFSSRGPNFLTLEVLKPDVIAPGLNILAAWSGVASPSSLSTDKRRVGFNILSGTSMSCPHVAGVAALVKAIHQDWTPSAIKSALMTTAYVHDNTYKRIKDASKHIPATSYDHGAGHINPSKAIDPGLIYDITAADYFEFLCTQSISSMQLKVFAKSSNRTCLNTMTTPGNLNYPAISAVFPEEKNITSMTLHRTVTNVGGATAIYHVRVSSFKGASIKVEPERLRFTKKLQKLSYKVTFVTKVRQSSPEFGGLVWKDGVHTARSPIVITWLKPLLN
ncbi:Subtilisin-like serine protease [Zostera marina]|uniref:Subtilisin-like serine protease n=1 Tax=Zostera marina TaxID=29655 RepID=A0A0K9PR33_ZOSMR|nr:Subtilisin-like serine protease [Zostera marina]